MFTALNKQAVRRARPQVGQITPLAVPVNGMNVRDAFAVMGPQDAIALNNVVVEPYGIRTRKGYTEWAINLPGPNLPVSTMMSYYPATAAPALKGIPFPYTNMKKMLVTPQSSPVPPAGKMFAATNGRIYDVTAGGIGPWTAEVGVLGTTDYWGWLNFQNIAGSFLVIANNGGGYNYYDGAAWTTPTLGVGVGQITPIDPVKFCYPMVFKKRLWFIEIDSTSAWYLPVGQLTGVAKEFNFGEQFKHGGRLSELVNFTVDGGEGIDDYLVAISSQGDVVVYKGTDPDDPTAFFLHGVWQVGPLPNGRRSVVNTGADIHILSQLGVTPLSMLLNVSGVSGGLEQRRTTYKIAPLIARLMRDFSTLPGWAVGSVPTEELLMITIPSGVIGFGGQFFVLKILTGAWSLLKELPYRDYVTIDSDVFAGTSDGRVVRAFDGPLDNVTLADPTAGLPIRCQVLPSFQPMGTPGQQKVFMLVRPTFITTSTPQLTIRILTDFSFPQGASGGSLPPVDETLWNIAIWNLSLWAGLQQPIKEWIGCRGVGFVGTVQLDYLAGGNTLLASIDFWTQQGGVL